MFSIRADLCNSWATKKAALSSDPFKILFRIEETIIAKPSVGLCPATLEASRSCRYRLRNA